jgi:hypothetical protein
MRAGNALLATTNKSKGIEWIEENPLIPFPRTIIIRLIRLLYCVASRSGGQHKARSAASFFLFSDVWVDGDYCDWFLLCLSPFFWLCSACVVRC